MKKGDAVALSLANWRGTPQASDGRTTGMMLRVMLPESSRQLLEIELSIEQFGHLLAGFAANATVHFVPTKK